MVGHTGGELLQDSSGDLFGSMMEYGQFGAGVVFKLSPETGTSLWNETVLYAFGAAAGDGSGPEQLVADAHGQLYVGTFRGGANNLGAVVEISGSGFQP